MFEKILVANRGEVVLRVIRACKEMGIRTVAVHSEADFDSLHRRYADEDICIGPPSSTDSYLNIPSIISAAEITDADAIHPGYGFLAENAHFAEICESCKIKFIGPSPDVIRTAGDKAKAREKVRTLGVPVVPGSDGIVTDQKQALQVAEQVGYPVMIKAAAGGGGRGLRLARNEVSLMSSFLTCRAEAEGSFGSPGVYIEKYREGARHIEFQIVGDRHGNVIHLGERDCTIQRRHQKLIEESPAPGLSSKMRKQMSQAALRIAKSVGYDNIGTVEFLVDKEGEFFFIEMNARLQVEHPVTEEVTGLDLVKEQVEIANGRHIGYSQRDVAFNGWSMECRIYAEDVDSGFKPCPGQITDFNVPGGPGVRVDTHGYQGYSIPPYYDALIAKIITHGRDRNEALARMIRALEEFVTEGVKTTKDFCLSVLKHDAFQRGEIPSNLLKISQEADFQVSGV